ncbi:hypothetical protein [Dehalobacterium formicoaceticum]|uniref:Uncharacterized protein n=1 Tax=Dehalobacterium formicoaceticum TaxID=51515 RepID=A0ABT1Y681_9FIRM|nr:hypothetical protein [Dehalobacterium formicoaceticum]MCR6546392.1 hypothetical protein [Dehalobacterium formicoaceticum]
MDVTIQAQIITLIRRLRNETGMSYLFISHDLALVQEISDRILVMYQGKLIEEGTPDEIIMDPQKAYTKRLVDAVL